MELNSELVTEAPRPAATVILLRDGDSGLEVFLLKRHGLSDVLGGAYVFPGGKLDASDAQLDAAQYLDMPLHVLHARLNEAHITPEEAAGLHVAALREAFEESGVLLAHSEDGKPANTAQAAAHLKEGLGFNDMLSRMGLRLHTSGVLPWSRWITPQVPSVTRKRFDTRFFLATVPHLQEAAHDDVETTASSWLAPRAALTQYWAGDIELAPPQIMTLAELSRHANVASAMTVPAHRPPPVIQPEPFDHEGTRFITYPGDERHSIQQRIWSGPTRLAYRNKRFEPLDGFESLFA
jgi:8-oxo-dGTP pyrophosphatase MutT (NUDIX family)